MKTLTHMETWQNLEGIMLIEINQLQYAKHCMIPDEVLKVIKVLR